jgi:hypothetical protein
VCLTRDANNEYRKKIEKSSVYRVGDTMEFRAKVKINI